jgi:hypothetical protein
MSTVFRVLICLGVFMSVGSGLGCDKDESNGSGAGSSPSGPPSAAASAEAPSESDIETAVKDDVAKGSDNKLKVTSVKKTDGKSMGGLYLAYVDVDIEPQEDFKWGVLTSPQGMAVSVTESREDFNAPLKKGETIKLKAVARMSKRESGWKLETGPRFEKR